MNSKFANQQHRAVQIIEFSSNSEFRAKKDVLVKIYNEDRIANLPLIVFCIAGAARKGKSFILNFFLDYLNNLEKYPNEPWQLDENTRLAGFQFQEGEDPTTMGIWAWSHVFVIARKNGQKVGVTLIDSQGTFDKNSSFKACSTIFAMTGMFSSIMCFNVFTDLQEDKLSNLATFVDHGKKIFDNMGGSGKLFQDLVIIVRDFCHKKYLDDKNGGQKYVENALGNVNVGELQQTRDGLNSSFERLSGFIFPHPGEIVATEKTTNIADINPKFVERVKEMVEKLLAQGEAKKVGPTVICCKNMVEYIQQIVKCFNEHPDFAPQAIQALNRNFLMNMEIARAVESYIEIIDKAFVNCKAGFENGKLNELHNSTFEQIESDISKRIKNEEVRSEIMEKFIEQMILNFQNYEEKNELLVENEKKRLKILEDERFHKEKLAQQEAEAKKNLLKQQKEYEQNQNELKYRHKMNLLIKEAENDRQRAVAQKENQEKMDALKNENDKKLAEEKRQRELDKAESDQKIADAKAESERKLENLMKEADKKDAENKKQIADLVKKHKNQELLGDFFKTVTPLLGPAVASLLNAATSDSSPPSGYAGPSRGYSGSPPGYSNSGRGRYQSSSRDYYGPPPPPPVYSDTTRGGYSGSHPGYSNSGRGGYQRSYYGPPPPRYSASTSRGYSGPSSYPSVPRGR